MRKSVLAFAVAIALVTYAREVRAQAPAEAGFKKLAALAGDWQGKDEEGKPVTTNFKVVAGNTAVLETFSPSTPEEMLTVYTVDQDSLVLAHYCPTKNQPRMRARPAAGEIKQLAFSFEGAGNLPSLSIGHEHKLLMEFTDANHIVEHWTWQKAGKDYEMVYHFTRKS